jgi:phage host-nuclease inhibitor protein Gam
MLKVDAFRGRLSDRIRYRLRNKNSNLVIILNGMTRQLQPLDMSISRPFKHYDAWLNKDNHMLTPSGKTKRAPASTIVEWISKAWKEVSVSIIAKIVFKMLFV